MAKAATQAAYKSLGNKSISQPKGVRSDIKTLSLLLDQNLGTVTSRLGIVCCI